MMDENLFLELFQTQISINKTFCHVDVNRGEILPEFNSFVFFALVSMFLFRKFS